MTKIVKRTNKKLKKVNWEKSESPTTTGHFVKKSAENGEKGQISQKWPIGRK